MKIYVSKNELLSKLRGIGKVIKPSREVVYSTFFLKTESENQIRVIGSDELGRIETTIDCRIENFEVKSFLLDSATLLNGLKELPEQPLTIHVNESNVEIHYNNGKFEIAQQSANIYPELKLGKESYEMNISGELLEKGFKTVSKFTATDDTLRPIMCAVNFSCKNEHVSFAASNGHVLGIYEEDLHAMLDFDVNIPTRIAKIISEMISGSDEPVNIVLTETNAAIKIGGYIITYRLTEGKYPNYRAIIPQNPKSIITLDCTETIASINRVSVFADDISTIVLDFSENTLTLSSESVDYARSAKESIMLDTVYSHFEIGFKSGFLSEAVKTIKSVSEKCTASFSGSDKAAMFRPKEMENTTIVLMPIMINNK